MKYKVGDEVEGIVTGVQPYGAFVYIEGDAVGLVHISEITDDYVEDITNYVKINDKIRVRILSVNKETYQMRLSMKALQPRKIRRGQHYSKRKTLPPMKIGFETLRQKLPQWIEEAKERMKL